MNRSIKTVPAPVTFARRPATAVCCPHCWTDQRAERDRCWHCGAQFRYLEKFKENLLQTETPQKARRTG